MNDAPTTGLGAARAAVSDGVVIVGAGQAGGRCAEALRAAGFTGRVTLVGDEVHLPYERPSLSKEMLLGEDGEGISWVRPEQTYAADRIGLRLGQRAVAINRAARSVVLASGEQVGYGALVLATGARVRRLSVPGAEAAPLHFIRTIEDSRALRPRLIPGARVLVIGAGFIGLEVAAAARQRGAVVTVIEAADRVMGRAVPPEISAHHAALHRAHGVMLQLGTGVASLAQEGETIIVRSTQGEAFHADVVVAGIGIEPNDELAREAALATDRGVMVDEVGMTEDPHIFAAGDVARHYNPLLGRHILLESWQNAQNQAIAIARIIAGGNAPYAEIPWFWSDQFGVNLQVVGLPVADAHTILRGSLGEGPSLLLQTQDGRVVSACGLGAPREVRFAKDLIASGVSLDEATLANPKTRLADIVRDVKQRRVPA